MTVVGLLFPVAVAADLEVHVKVPGLEPVWATLADVRRGSTHRIEFPGEGKVVYHLTMDVEEPTDGYDWCIAFELGSVESWRGGRRTRSRIVAQPTMQAHTNERAQFLVGNTAPVLYSDPPARWFHGYSIEWIVTPSAQP